MQFFTLVLAILVLVLGWWVLRIHRAMRELEGSVKSRRRLLVKKRRALLDRVGLSRLTGEVNGLIDLYNEHDREKAGYLNQIEATLGSVYDAVLVLDERHTIVFANEAARRLFQGGKPLSGMRLETVMRSTSLLEYLAEARGKRVSPRREVQLEQGGETLWFEVSSTQVEDMPVAENTATLLVLHDISRLKRLEVMRREFVANVSHELRTPLTIIKGFAETLVDDNESLPKASRVRFLDKIMKNAERLHVLVEDLLTLSRLESKPEQLNAVKQSFPRFVSEIVDSYQARIDSDRQELIFESEPIPEFEFDPFRLNQVLDNLLENVFRYATDFTRLVVRCRLVDEGRVAECSISDDGPGIPAKDVPHIFQRFYRVDKGRSRERGGTGLGLSIAKHIIRLHGGNVWVESVEGEGTTVFFTLPLELSDEVPVLLPEDVLTVPVAEDD